MKTDEITTTDLSNFGARERAMAADLLTASKEGFPVDFNDDGVTVMMNRNSGNVFLTNSDFQVCMMADGKLESFYSCPQCGLEGFWEEVKTVKEHGQTDSSTRDDLAQCRLWIADVKKGRA